MESEKYIYIMASSISQRAMELYHISSTYEGIVKAFYSYHLKEHNEDFIKNNRNYWFMELYKFPVDYDYTYGEIVKTNEKLSKSSKHRIKFKDWNELKEEYKKINRESQISNIIN